MKGMEGYEIFLLVVGFIFGFLICVVGIGIQLTSSITELGTAICEEEFGLDYKIYSNDELTCKNKVISEKYNGLKIIHELGD